MQHGEVAHQISFCNLSFLIRSSAVVPPRHHRCYRVGLPQRAHHAGHHHLSPTLQTHTGSDAFQVHAGTQCAVRRVCLNLSAPRQHLDDAQQLENMLSYDEQVRATSAPAAALLDRCRSARPLPLCSTAAAVAHVRASPDRHGAGLERQAAASDRTSSCYCALRTKSPRSASEVARNGPSRHIHTGARARWRPAQVLGSSAQTSLTTCGRPTRADH